jgi:hypothetical protein
MDDSVVAALCHVGHWLFSHSSLGRLSLSSDGKQPEVVNNNNALLFCKLF